MSRSRTPFSRSALGRTLVGAAVAAGLIVLSACSSTPAGTSSSDGSGLDTVTAGKLTIATGEPAYFPWVIDDKPEEGKGFEAAVAYAVADKLGYAKDDVVWTRSTFDSAIAPGPKDFDLNLQQFTITDDRKKAVDFSSAYYTTTQAVITTSTSKAAGVTTIDGLKDVSVGVAAGSTSYTVAKKELGTEPQVFNSNDDAVLALTSGQVDSLVVDLPTAFYLTGVQIDGGKILGQFADDEGGDQFGILLAKGSALTTPVTAAVDALREDGTLDKLATEWLSSTADAPVLK
ncbi:ABC transporter substrate-binding protein [Agreia sp. COWG]|uniref:ABC transporter substrate-binding protein n=1 Tax=Agreia sp. COWG TaxID=2773266 RepID=UPI001F318896|nr:ABC transporter substrate-binding protein [Agreia sp. COWG]